MRDYYTTPRHDDELPVGTRVKVVKQQDNEPPFYGEQGSVKGYFASDYEITGGWHCIQFDNREVTDLTKMPYVNRIYLEVIE